MSGIQEWLVIALIILALIYLPRRSAGVKARAKKTPLSARMAGKLTGILRVAIVATIAVPAVAAVIFQPWHSDMIPFLIWGVGPVLAGWSVFWIVKGYHR